MVNIHYLGQIHNLGQNTLLTLLRETEAEATLNKTLSVSLCDLFRFHKEAVPALWLEFSRFYTVMVREFLCKNGCKVSKEK